MICSIAMNLFYFVVYIVGFMSQEYGIIFSKIEMSITSILIYVILLLSDISRNHVFVLRLLHLVSVGVRRRDRREKREEKKTNAKAKRGVQPGGVMTSYQDVTRCQPGEAAAEEDNHRCQSEKGTKIVKLGESGCEARTEKKTDGNWLSHIMIRTKQTTLLKQMILSCFHSFIEAFPVKTSDISLIEDLHISLSQPFNLRYFLIKPFLSQLQTTCARIEAKSSSVAVVNQCRLLYNNQRSRAFMTLKVIDTSKYLEKCVLHIDEVMKEYNFPVYYQPPIFHISIFSFPLTDPSDCDIYNDWNKDWQDFDITEDEGIHRDIGKGLVEAESDNEEEDDEMLEGMVIL
eukprot:gene5220-5596_t